MASPSDLVFNLDTARRPGIDDVGGGAKVEGTPRPDPVRHLTANDVNQWAKLLVAIAKVMPIAIIEVRFSAGTPSFHNLIVPGDDLAIGDLQIFDNGVGDTSIGWPAGSLPVMSGRPWAVATTSGDHGAIAVEEGANGIRVYTRTAGVLADVNFQAFVI